MDRPRRLDREDEDKLDLWAAQTKTPGSYKPFSPPSSLVEVEFGALSHPSLRRATSDDHYLILELERHQATIATSLSAGTVPERFDGQGYGVVVADGMGTDGPTLPRGTPTPRSARVARASHTHLTRYYSPSP